MRRSAAGSGMAVNILTPMPPKAERRGRDVELVELRVLDGPNRFFTRPAVKLEFVGAASGQAAEVAAEAALAVRPLAAPHDLAGRRGGSRPHRPRPLDRQARGARPARGGARPPPAPPEAAHPH